MKKLARNPRFWPIPVMILALSVLHYAGPLGIPGVSTPGLGSPLSRYSLDQLLFLIPMAYAAYAMRFNIGVATCLVAFLVMVPHAVLFSQYHVDALLEIGGVMVAGLLACFWFEAQRRAVEQKREATKELESVQENLQTQIRLSRSNAKRLATLNSISSMLSRSLEAEHLLRSAIELVTEVMEVEVAMIYTLDKDFPQLRLAAFDGVSDRFVAEAKSLSLDVGFSARVVRTGEPVLVDDASDDPGLSREILSKEKLRAELIVPLRSKGVITGTLCVANRRPRHFLPEEIELLTAIGAQIGVALDNTDLYRQEQLIAEQYRAIFDNAAEAIWLQDLQGEIVKANQAAARLTGYGVEELLHLSQIRLLPDRAQGAVLNTERIVLGSDMQAGEPYDQRMTRKDGSEVLVRVGSSPIYEGGQLVGYQYIATDVTKERLMQESLRHYIEAITKAQEEERKRIARELHDETAQQLVALSHQLDDFIGHNYGLSAEDLHVLKAWRLRLSQALQGVRLFSRDLRPPMIDDLGLVASLEWLTGQVSSESKMEVALKVAGAQRRLTPETELLLFRIVQEALNNARRHAEASSVEVAIEFGEHSVSAVVTDNGKGFQMPGSVGDLSRAGKLGLMGIEERAHLLGASLTIDSSPGRGTRIIVKTPV